MVNTPDFDIKLKQCEYIKRLDILVTSGSMWWDGDPYYIELVEGRSSSPIMSLANNTSDLEYSEGEEIFGNLDAAHNKQIPEIYSTMISKAAEYQHTSHEAILARISYESKNTKQEQIVENQDERQGSTMKEFEVNFDSCEYDAESDTMRTTGKASFNGKEYDASFIEHDGQNPAVCIRNDAVEVNYQNGGNFDGYGLNTDEGKTIRSAADSIFRTMYEKADEYQNRDAEAICARISYENKDMDDTELEVEDISRNTGDVGDLVGVVRINEDTLRFTADRDGSIYSLMPTAASMQDVRTVPIADEVKDAICDAIREGIVDYIEHEENPAKDMAYPPIAPDEIKGMSVDEVIEYCDWDMDEHEDGSITLESHSPAGEDLIIETSRDSLVEDLRAEAENFDPDEHAEIWAEIRGTRGVPESVRTLVEDAEAIQQKYFQLSNAVEIADREQQQERNADDYER